MPTRSCVHPAQVGDLPVVGHVIPYQLPQCRGHAVVARLGSRREGDRPVQVLVGERGDVLPSRRLNRLIVLLLDILGWSSPRCQLLRTVAHYPGACIQLESGMPAISNPQISFSLQPGVDVTQRFDNVTEAVTSERGGAPNGPSGGGARVRSWLRCLEAQF